MVAVSQPLSILKQHFFIEALQRDLPMKNLFSILLVLLLLPFSSHAQEDSGAIFNKIASGCKAPYKQSFESEALNESIKAYDSYTKCLRGKIDFLTQDYFIKDEKSVNFYNHKQFMHALDSVDDKYGSMMRALYLNGKGLLDENGKRSWEGSEARINVYSKIAKFHETLLMDILSLYTDLEIPLPSTLANLYGVKK